MADFDIVRFMDKAEWMADANCLGLDPDIFFPARGEATAQVKQICRECDVQSECLAYALNNGEKHGIWGGMSERDRRKIRRSRAVNARGPIPPPAICCVMSTAPTTATNGIVASAASRAQHVVQLMRLPNMTAVIGA